MIHKESKGKEKSDADALKPPFQRNQDQQINELIEKMQKLIRKFQIRPFHQNVKPISNR